MDDVIRYADEHAAQFLNDVIALARIPSISSASERGPDMVRCAEHLAARMRAAGVTRAEVIPTGGQPIVYGEWMGAPGKPTALVYGHYDVQPVDPVDLWDSPPFEPAVRDGLLYGRGVSDDKGQVMMHIAAVEAWLRAGGGLPVNLKLLIEGEEEIGSDHFGAFVKEHGEQLAADVLVISDTSLFAKGLPAICYGLRGILYFQIDVEVAGRDLHSGSYGGSVGNPIDVIAHIIAGLKDAQGRVQVPGFYDEVRPMTRQERDEFGRLPYTDAGYLRETGASALFGEPGYTTFERTWTRPTLEPNGVWGGFTGEGTKTVLPARASAKISCRLVPDQDPARVAHLFKEHVRGLCPAWARLRITEFHSGKPALTPIDHPAVQATARALEAGFGVRPVFVRAGGSIPAVTMMQEALGVPVVLMGIGLPDDHAHAPNERLDVESFNAGIRGAAHLWAELAKVDGS
jgi:acetylornithine deacetylase/succinyl-diaminopimelate desuccinylase-like protein